MIGERTVGGGGRERKHFARLVATVAYDPLGLEPPTLSKGRTVMAKGNQKPKKNVKKPKQDKAPKK